MVVLILEKVPATLRGELSRWMIEPRAGVFVGDVSAMVRDRLWQKACWGAKGGGVMLLHTSQTEQGFSVRIFGDTTRDLVDWEGLTLVHIPKQIQGKTVKRGSKKEVDEATME
jgi:CRISPR-associated protein Cas2